MILKRILAWKYTQIFMIDRLHANADIEPLTACYSKAEFSVNTWRTAIFHKPATSLTQAIGAGKLHGPLELMGQHRLVEGTAQANALLY